MSMYSMVFGKNPMSEAILATLGLTRADCGRFRDCFIANGKIAVYTRNGGGNRHCWCKDDPKYGYKDCKHHVVQEEEDEKIFVNKEDVEKYPEAYNIISGSQRLVGTGKRITKDYYFCENPNSSDCACPGCTINHRLPKHPNYLYDENDDFDSTYATIYFSFPDEYAEDIKKLDNKEEFKPSERWLKALENLKENS